MISNCGKDENGRYSGGRAGDQSGTEWNLCNWYQYSGGWQYMIRHPNPAVGQLISDLAKEAANNNLIGYDQDERLTFWEHLKASGYRPKGITIPCEADCSSGVAAIVKAVGYLLKMPELQRVSADCYTGNIRSALAQAGFMVYGSAEYLNSEKYLRAGDFLLKEYNHICTVVSGGGGGGGSFNAVYKVRCGGRWLPEVTDLADYAGISGQPITDVAVRFTQGSCRYRVHEIGRDWLPWVTGYNTGDSANGYAGDGHPIDMIQIFLKSPDGSKCAKYRVAPVNRDYYDWQIDTQETNGQDGYAGDVGVQIDRLQLYVWG